jgi:hypothetical protein
VAGKQLSESLVWAGLAQLATFEARQPPDGVWYERVSIGAKGNNRRLGATGSVHAKAVEGIPVGLEFTIFTVT